MTSSSTKPSTRTIYSGSTTSTRTALAGQRAIRSSFGNLVEATVLPRPLIQENLYGVAQASWGLYQCKRRYNERGTTKAKLYACGARLGSTTRRRSGNGGLSSLLCSHGFSMGAVFTDRYLGNVSKCTENETICMDFFLVGTERNDIFSHGFSCFLPLLRIHFFCWYT